MSIRIRSPKLSESKEEDRSAYPEKKRTEPHCCMSILGRISTSEAVEGDFCIDYINFTFRHR